MIDKQAPFEILLVEDEPADVHLVKLALDQGKIDCCLHHVADGVAALAYLRGRINASRPDLILLDLNMPRMNGREFLATVKADAQLVAIPVVVLTTSAVEQDVAEAYRLGAAGYVVKPADMHQFFNSINQLCTYWFTVARLPRS